jgi:drug/metabolite transporter (DMT)-like permease
MNIAKAILLKLASALVFALMSALVRYLGESVPIGQVVFFRSACALLPVVLIYAWRRELGAAVRTGRPLGHLGRGLISVAGMFLNFAALARLPLVDATAISFAAPLITVAFAAIFLGEHVRIYRWSAVFLGFLGVLVMLWSHFSLEHLAVTGSVSGAIGAVCAVAAAFTNAGSVIQTRRLTMTETTSSIVLYFSVICAIAGLLTLPFGWVKPTGPQLAALIGLGIFGGLAHILLTESYRYAAASVVAPFDYSAMVWALVLGYVLFQEVPTLPVYVGSAIIATAGLLVIFRERQLGLRRAREAEGPPTGA